MNYYQLRDLMSSYIEPMLLFFAFVLLHSYGAQEKFKEAGGRILSPFFMCYFWRVIYCFLSWLLFYPLFLAKIMSVPQPFLLYPMPIRILVDGIHLLGGITFFIASWQFDIFEFLGLRAAYSGLKRIAQKDFSAAPQPFAGVTRLETNGLYSYIRHPMGSATLAVSFPGWLSVNSVIIFILVSGYVLIARHFEERRLIRIFGAAYVNYMSNVPAYIPNLLAAAKRRGS